jgi:hypothetical protein
MRTNTAKRWFLAAGAAAAVGLSTPARPDIPSSSGPGTLGVEVPYDSRVAREYYQYFLPTDTPEALRIRDAVQRLHADQQAAMELGRAGATSQDAQVRKLGQRVVEELGSIDSTLVWVAKDSLIELSGTSYDAAAQEATATLAEVQAASGPERDQRWLSGLVAVLGRAFATVEELQPQARRAHRQQLGSVLTRAHKVLQGELAAANALAPALPPPG